MDFAEDLLLKIPFLIIIVYFFFLRQVLLCNVARLHLELSNFLSQPQDLGPACSSAGVIDLHTTATYLSILIEIGKKPGIDLASKLPWS